MRRPARVGHTHDLPRSILAHKKDCGCTLGAVFMMVTLLVSLAWILFDHRLSWLEVLMRLPLVGLLALLAAGVGKAVGILYTRDRSRALSNPLTRDASWVTGEGTHHGGNVG
jgi:ABC-type polysaccharide/polyol phosphate export permease